MSSAKPAVSFDDIIQADRKRRQNEALANEIFGRSRPANDSVRNANSRKTSQTPSLASRVGVAKRSSSSTNIKTQKAHPFNPPSRPSSAASQIARTNRIASAVNNTKQANVVSSPQPGANLSGAGLSIRGTAGPFVVEASNFAPGTTAADIESALQIVAVDSNGSNGLTSCRITSAHPTVVAEMIFSEKHLADTVITTFNNQKADGRILRVQMKRSGPGAVQSIKKDAIFTSDTAPLPAPPTTDLFDGGPVLGEMEDIEMSNEPPVAYDNAREAANQDRRERESRRAEPDIQDGRYGFASGGNTKSERSTTAEVTQPQPPSQPRDDRDGAGGRRDDDRERERHRDGDRERRYDEGRYERRDERGSGPGAGSYHRGHRPETYDSRGGGGGRSSHYGNGVGSSGGGRGYPGASSGGRMYSDDMIRGGRGGGPRGGGYRGGYR